MNDVGIVFGALQPTGYISMSMATEHTYLVREDGIVSGPLPLGHLRAAFMRKTMEDNVELKRDDETEWHRPSTLPEFADLFSEPSPDSTMAQSPRAFRVKRR